MDLRRQMERIEAAIKDKKFGIYDYEAIKLESRKKAAEERSHEMKQRLLQAVPQLYQGKTFADFNIDYEKQVIIKNIAMRYVKTFSERKAKGSNLIFTGPSGTGKTLLALIIYQALVHQGYSTHYEPNLQCLRQFRDKNFAGHDVFSQYLKTYADVDFLIIDEITEGLVKGGEFSSWEKEMLFTLINTRYQAKLITLVISNRNISHFKFQLGERIASRLLEEALVLAMDWPSYR